jgi:hypothetical protein
VQATLPFERGPYLLAALICEKVLEEKDGVKSAIRIIDRITRTEVGPSPPREMEPFKQDLTLLVKLKSGEARGSYPLEIRLVKPSGESPTPLTQTIYFEGEEDRGIDVLANMKITFDLTGVYWFHIYLSEVRLTQIPLRIIYLPQVRQIPGPGGRPPPAQEPPLGS